MISINANFKEKNILATIAKKYNITLIYVFGSQVGTAINILKGITKRPEDSMADIDVGLVLQKKLPGPKEIFQFYSFIYNELQELFNPFPLDLVFLQETHSVFQAQAICGECIYSVSPSIKEKYEEDILRRAADFKPFLKMYLDEILEEVK